MSIWLIANESPWVEMGFSHSARLLGVEKGFGHSAKHAFGVERELSHSGSILGEYRLSSAFGSSVGYIVTTLTPRTSSESCGVLLFSAGHDLTGHQTSAKMSFCQFVHSPLLTMLYFTGFFQHTLYAN